MNHAKVWPVLKLANRWNHRALSLIASQSLRIVVGARWCWKVWRRSTCWSDRTESDWLIEGCDVFWIQWTALVVFDDLAHLVDFKILLVSDQKFVTSWWLVLCESWCLSLFSLGNLFHLLWQELTHFSQIYRFRHCSNTSGLLSEQRWNIRGRLLKWTITLCWLLLTYAVLVWTLTSTLIAGFRNLIMLFKVILVTKNIDFLK